MKKNTAIYLNFITSALFFTSAIIGYFSDNSMATVWLCLGSLWLCIGAVNLKNSKTNSEENKTDN